MRTGKLFWLICASLTLFAACDEEYNRVDPEPDPENPTTPVATISDTTLKVNAFVNDFTQLYYLWSDEIDWTKTTPDKEPDSYAFFDKLKYKDDQWSMLTDDLGGLEDEFAGTVTSFGYALIFGRFSDSDDLFAVVLFVYPGTPADRAGLKRGDFIVGMNGGSITIDNRMELYDAKSIMLTRGQLTEFGLAADPTLIVLNAETMYEDPILKDTVIVKGANRIGYLSYADYTEKSEVALQQVFSKFKSQGVTDVVLDLRYNGGGYVRTMSVLVSILAPQSAVKSKSIYLRQIWNQLLNAYWKSEGDDLAEHFTDTLSVNMNLSRLYVLTSEYSASASESTIVGLRPYLNLVQIGDTTHGKYCAGSLFEAMVQDRRGDWVEDATISNWGMYLMIYRVSNVNSDNSFNGGLAPDIYAEEDYFPLMPWGDERDPLLGKAIEDITGVAITETRSATPKARFDIRKDLTVQRFKFGKMIAPLRTK
ncbi:MAG: hypothetical protein LBR50_01005 [Tannerella sp.]|jgi:C-terminal processing protease CtpA/Prc|nr:hypothetical protein [Tannerella sp.]